MQKSLLLLTAVTGLFASQVHGQNLILNGDFEMPALSGDGNHIGTSVPDWVSSGSQNSFNLVQNGSQGIGSGILKPYQGSQTLDGTSGDFVFSQSFTLDHVSALTLSLSIGRRDDTGGPGAFASIVDAHGQTFYTSATLNPGFTDWATFNGTTAPAATGTYTLNVSLPDAFEVDAVSVTPVPEPSALLLLAMSGGGLLGMQLLRRFRRRA